MHQKQPHLVISNDRKTSPSLGHKPSRKSWRGTESRSPEKLVQRVIFLAEVGIDASHCVEVVTLTRRQIERYLFRVQTSKHLGVLSRLIQNVRSHIYRALTSTRYYSFIMQRMQTYTRNTENKMHHFLTVSLWAQNLPVQKILSSTLVCFCLSDWSYGSRPFTALIRWSVFML